ncbi:ankyrin repeat and SOCS box protein 14 isoform X2 [Danio aesculapii]|uniref:ankyrin repeat and SOCS box protein 14 isoform X2 n=1 Tax=Danio aesculapii TaxID=1142201 RepID=UPI0024C038CF|nr:ankyrin repeat and SOCS box protein 14 isoform X2 [Danio aesculapii]
MDVDTSGGILDEDVAMQMMIEQSLQQSHKPTQLKSSYSGDACRIVQISPEREKIFSAIKDGDENSLRKLTVHDCCFSEEDSTGFIPLHEAAIQNNLNILQITFTASPEEAKHRKTHRGKTALFLAVEKGLLDNTFFLLDHGSSPDPLDKEEDSPLIVAIRNDQREMVDLLLRFGARVNQECVNRRTALHEAARLGLTEILDLLIKNGAHADPRSSFGLTPLALAAQAGYLDIMRTLIHRGADVESQAQDCATILFEACISGNPDVISLLLKSGADANVPKHTGHLPIHRVAHRGHLKALALLIPVTSWDAVDDSGISPLHSAAAGGHTHCLEMLLNAGYDPNFMLHPWVRRSYDDKRQSALYFAVSNDDVSSARVLLEAGAMPNQDPVKCLQFCEVISVSFLKHLSGSVVRIMMDYVDHVNFCSKLKAVLMEQKQWAEICHFQENVRCLQHLCRLKIRACLGRLRLRAPIFMSFLPLPKRLKHYIQYREYDLYGQKCQTQSK